MKYIESEKLIAEIERRLKIVEPHKDTFESAAACRQELIWMKEFITSLQQEQPESICPRCAYHNKTDDFCEYPYGGRKCSINENGVYECNGFEVVEQQEQPEVDLEKEVQRWKNKHGVVGMDDLWLKFARHFYELGLNAIKDR